jgi:hypothetical protein
LKLFIAVVLKAGQASQRTDGDWACFVNKDKKVAITQAIKARSKWEAKGFGPYQIQAGTLTQEVNIPVEFKLAAIKQPKEPKTAPKLMFIGNPPAACEWIMKKGVPGSLKPMNASPDWYRSHYLHGDWRI